MQEDRLLEEFKRYLRSEGQRLHTINSNTNIVKQFLNWLVQENINYLELTYTDLLAYINYNQSRGNAKNTINGKLQGIRHFYNCLQQKQLINHNPAEELRIRGVITRQPHDLLVWEELEQLYQTYPTNSTTGKRNKAMLGMVIYQGLNSGEVGAIELKDVKLEEAKIAISSVSRSNSRILKLASIQILQLQKYITEVRPVLMAMKGGNSQSDLLFVSSGKGDHLANSLIRLMTSIKRLNPKIKSLKQIRASVITHWLREYHIREVQYMTGHKYVSSTERYRTDLLETLQEQLEEMHPLK